MQNVMPCSDLLISFGLVIKRTHPCLNSFISYYNSPKHMIEIVLYPLFVNCFIYIFNSSFKSFPTSLCFSSCSFKCFSTIDISYLTKSLILIIIYFLPVLDVSTGDLSTNTPIVNMPFV